MTIEIISQDTYKELCDIQANEYDFTEDGEIY